MGWVNLAIFAKAPESASVKSRLVPALGAAGARAAHRELVERTLTQLAGPSTDFRASLWVTRQTRSTQRWAADFDLASFEQTSGDLGQRMFAALDVLLADDACAGAGIVGTDCPTIDAAYVDAGCAMLSQYDVVFGPAVDGGYGLVMCREALRELFTDIVWGTDTVLHDSVQRARDLNRSVGLLDPIWDVDRPEDWVRYCELRDSVASTR